MSTGRDATPPPAMAREEGVVLGGLIALFLITAAWWALAFWPLEAGPAWLERTRYACFGVRESGLPDAGGWIGLIAGPLGMLAVLSAGWSGGMRTLLQRARHSRSLASVFALLLVGVIALVTIAAVRVQQARPASLAYEDDVPPSTYPRLDRAAPPLVLQSHDGGQRRLTDLEGRIAIITFAYAHCATVCPVVVTDALAAQTKLTARGERPVVLIVTLDPWRDTPSRLPGMARSWGLPPDDALVLGGAVDDVERTLDDWGVARSRDVTTGEITHPALTFIIDRTGRIAYATNGGASSIVSLVERL